MEKIKEHLFGLKETWLTEKKGMSFKEIIDANNSNTIAVRVDNKIVVLKIQTSEEPYEGYIGLFAGFPWNADEYSQYTEADIVKGVGEALYRYGYNREECMVKCDYI